MKRFFPTLKDSLRNSMLARVAIVMGFLALLSLGSIVISALIADDISGRASAVNVSGSLRMLSFRTLSELQQPDKRDKAVDTIKQFEKRLLGLERFTVSKSAPGSPSVLAVRGVLQRWMEQIRPLELAAAGGDAGALAQAAIDIPDFVDQIDKVVRLIEEELESKASLLRVVQLGLLAGIVVISVLTILMLRAQLVLPLAQLLQAAKTVTQGSFSVRVEHVSNDELGQLGRAFNAMVAEIANMYAHLEEKVDEKTRELTRTNQSLELLYRISQQLSASDLTLDKLQAILREVEDALELGHSMICISDNGHFPAHTVLGDLTQEEVHHWCGEQDCSQCFARSAEPLAEQARSGAAVVIPIGEAGGLRGTLPIMLRSRDALPVDKLRVIETVGHHVSNALINMRRTEEKHRLAVLEERSVIARELHDSIAQSLSYLKIQVTRLEKSIDDCTDARVIALELKDGLSTAYRELRELITTFRLRIDERGFGVALQETVAEFSTKIGSEIALRNAVSGIVLSGNEEMHVIRIIREALSNIERHAGAHHAGVEIAVDAGQMLTVRITDDGRGFDPGAVPAHHFGTSIMEDRAHILGGQLDIRSIPGAGTTVTLQFLPQIYRQAEP
ncbi:MAG: histidine kinase [Betaproteobacteria bacterium]|jgi:two-component system nitrate/nitrite sensor histidine kinase NarX